ncbi:aminotransferase class III-fold pyridoxal phosphate-dependent enzyme [Calidifontibacter sp. DB0510]|uniref:Adenosylmethionine-8-amino-7-oxononanoate aminotransferase n=1 Tax=Metallococcus carri TaxID=1656884 RepID=A0A967B7Y8_9MICO|nr:aminotransferase class III-fold pyridoxal phosphate-dependent enzyme [Metallococcus carri]NHN57252.1 aminotransferase class III-fold pyridoxal phosphate-dependent enzyme [Metallococcus carri]NOP37945.1 aminotransferase class III-fold pyridoxal phosphate-dependent enzyme [Calidifontibacter sp. DB2511S]
MQDLLAFDRDHVWHPYASALNPAPTLLVESASGVRLRVRMPDGSAREVIDGMSSWWCAIHGYAVPELDAAAHAQLARMSHVMFGGLTHEPAITLADKLIDLAPGSSLQHVFFADSGSVSVEVALKMAWQVFAAAGRPRSKVFTVRGGYHGDTLAPMSVCDPVNGMHTLFRGVLPQQVFAPLPPAGLGEDLSGVVSPDSPAASADPHHPSFAGADAGPGRSAASADPHHPSCAGADAGLGIPAASADLHHPSCAGADAGPGRSAASADPHHPSCAGADAMAAWERETRALFAQHADDIAAVIVEPVLQGAGGMRIWPPECVRLLASLAREAGALVIFDEIATGFGRTGTMWAADRCGVVPDIMCVGKALTGGYLTMAAVLCSADVAAAVSAEPAGALMHGPTFMANPLACAIANASIDLLLSRGLEPVHRIGDRLAAGLAPARDLPQVADVRTIGAVGVVQLDRPVNVAAASAAALERGVWLRPFRDLIYTMPPYVCTDADVAAITGSVLAAAGASR